MIITFDPTDRAQQTLNIDGRMLSWVSAGDRAGSRLIAELKKLNLSTADELRVVAGPGHFTGIRIAALAANAVAKLTGARLFSRRADESDWQSVKQIEPYYAAAPQITPAKDVPRLARLEQRLSLRPRESRLRRVFEIGGGVILVAIGIVAIPLPVLSGAPFIIPGVLLISPWHGRRLAWFVVHAYRWAQQGWHRVRHGRQHKNNSKRHKIWPFS